MSTQKILLINPASSKDRKSPEITTNMASSTIPLGVLSIGSYLEREGHSVQIIDSRLYSTKKELHLLRSSMNSSSFVGISLMTPCLPDTIQILDLLNDLDPDLPVVVGGPHPTLFPEQCLEEDSIDFVVMGEGEKPMSQLCKHVMGYKPLKDIKNIGFKTPKININIATKSCPDIDDLPPLAYHLLEYEEYIQRIHWNGKKIRCLEVPTSRGCPNRCAFCINEITQRRWRGGKPSLVLDNLNHVIDKYNLNHVHLFDENFFPNPKRARGIIEGLLDLDVTWETTARLDYFSNGILDENLLNLMERSGCISLSSGAESGSQRILNLLNKNITVDDILTGVKAMKKKEILPILSFMIGMPEEKQKDALATLKLINKIKRIYPKTKITGPQMFRPYPGGSLYEKCKLKGLKEPKTLMEWSQKSYKTSGYLDDFPWIEDPEFIKNLIFYCQLSQREEDIQRIPRTFIKILRGDRKGKEDILTSIFASISRMRIESGVLAFPFEKRAFFKLKKIWETLRPSQN